MHKSETNSNIKYSKLDVEGGLNSKPSTNHLQLPEGSSSSSTTSSPSPSSSSASVKGNKNELKKKRRSKTPPKVYKTPAIFASEKPIFNTQSVPVIVSHPTPPMTAYVESRPGNATHTPETPAPFAIDDEFNLPVSLALIILILYILLGSFIFTFTDNWRLFESFYFVYISMSTIGFGDYVPSNSVSMIASSIYLLFGLALTSMCINVIQERLSESFEKAKVHLGNQLGFDINQINDDSLVGQTGKPEMGKQVGFELKTNNIGQSLKQRREKLRQSSERSTISTSDRISDQSSNRSSLDQGENQFSPDQVSSSSNRSSQISQKSTQSSDDDDSIKTLVADHLIAPKSRSSSPIKYSDL